MTHPHSHSLLLVKSDLDTALEALARLLMAMAQGRGDPPQSSADATRRLSALETLIEFAQGQCDEAKEHTDTLWQLIQQTLPDDQICTTPHPGDRRHPEPP